MSVASVISVINIWCLVLLMVIILTSCVTMWSLWPWAKFLEFPPAETVGCLINREYWSLRGTELSGSGLTLTLWANNKDCLSESIDVCLWSFSLCPPFCLCLIHFCSPYHKFHSRPSLTVSVSHFLSCSLSLSFAPPLFLSSAVSLSGLLPSDIFC